MNDLYLIGNGFDLAHGLKTSYNDFLLWYLEELVGRAETGKFSDELAEVDGSNSQFIFESQGSISKLLQYSKRKNISIKYKNEFFQRIVENYRDYRWIDIEYEYYLNLVQLYDKRGMYGMDYVLQDLKSLNNCFESITKKLVEYLTSIQITPKYENRNIESILLEGNGSDQKENGEKLYLYFNYTPTMELYSRNFFRKNNLVYIHGKLKNTSNPIIFGYGDEMDPHYEKIENLNNNEFLRNIKSFGYSRTSNYQRVNSFIEGEGKDFTVKILGHSCGLSDRILLNTIFEHPNCKAIKIYYYQKSETENDYFEKTQEISRHFKASGKGDMRTKIVPFEKSVPLVPFISKN